MSVAPIGAELQEAEKRAEQSRRELGDALGHLRDTVDAGFRRVDAAVYRAQAPVRLARSRPLLAQGVLLAFVFLVGIAGGRRAGKARLARGRSVRAPRAYLGAGEASM